MLSRIELEADRDLVLRDSCGFIVYSEVRLEDEQVEVERGGIAVAQNTLTPLKCMGGYAVFPTLTCRCVLLQRGQPWPRLGRKGKGIAMKEAAPWSMGISRSCFVQS